MEDNPRQYIMTIEYGDPNTNLALRTAVGIFQTQEVAEAFRIETYTDTNHICMIYPLNVLFPLHHELMV